MRVVILALALLYCFSLKAQDTAGIKFEKGLSWAQLKEKAKKENKYIFVDCFTTWCAPCRIMDKEVFSTREAGEFFNASFINVKVQFDRTKNDGEDVRGWYEEVEIFKKAYAIGIYPTYLFFDPNGVLVHKISGGVAVPGVFINRSKAALDPKSQYYSLKAKFDAGRRDAPFLRSLLRAAEFVGETEAVRLIANEYLSEQKDQLTEDNLRLMASSTLKVSDVGFEVLRRYPAKADQYLGSGTAATIVRQLILDDIMVPMLREGGRVQRSGGLLMLSGSVKENVQWNTVCAFIGARYPELVDEVTLASKIMYYEWTSDWSAFCKSLSSFVAEYGDRISRDQLHLYAWAVLKAGDNQCAETAASWMNKLVAESGGNAGYAYVEANLLYKANKKEDATAKIKQLIRNEGDSSGELASLLEKMNKGEKIF